MKIGGANEQATQNRAVRASSKLWCDISFSAFALLVVPSAATAQANLTWDVNGAVAGTGGTGTWNTATPIWFDGAGFVPWSNGSFDNAIFGGTAGAVTVGGTINVHNITFNTPSYSLTGGTLNLGGASPTITSNANATINSVLAGTTGFSKNGTGTLTLTGINTYTGNTNLDGGSLVIGATNALPTTSTLIMNSTGSGTTPATLDLNGFSQTLGGLRITNTNTTTADTIVIGAGQALTVNGAVTIGRDGVSTTTLATISGAGSFVNNNVGGTFQVGGGTGATNRNKATLDMSGLAGFSANLGSTGIFRVGDTGNASFTGFESTVRLAATSTITADLMDIGATSGHFDTLNTLKLGSTQNTIHANRIALGTTTSGRSNGEISFNGATGALSLRDATGAGRAQLQMADVTNVTLSPITAIFDTRGHQADLLISNLLLGRRILGAATATGSSAATFSFDTGRLDVTSVAMGQRSNLSGASNVDAILNIGGGTAVIGAVDTMGQNINAVGTGAANATLNISGGTVSIGSITNMALNGAANGAVTSTLNFTGGTINLGGNITRNTTASGSNSTATLNLDGATLDMGGFSIFGALGAYATNANFRSGTLKNVAEIMNGAGLTKTTAGTLVLEGANNYGGMTNINAGVVNVRSDTGLGAAATGTSVAAGAALQLQNNITVGAEALTLNGTGVAGDGALRNISGNNTYGGVITLGSAVRINSDAGNLSLTGGIGGAGQDLTVGGASNTAISGVIGTTTGGLTKDGGGALVLTGANTYAGTTAINAGTLQVGNGGTSGTLGTGAVSNNASLMFNRSDVLSVGNVITGAGTIRQIGSGLTNLTANSGAFTGTTSVEAGTLAVNGRLCGTLNVQSGGKLQGTGTVCNTNNFTGGIVAPGNSIGTLTIAGNYTGNGGVLEMETILSGTGSPADRLLITGNATGTTPVKTINLGGTGALTGFGNSDGVSIIQVGGTSTADTFQLQGGYAAAGPYQYRLNFFAPGASAAAQADPLLGTAVFGDYRLQSAVDASGAPIPVPQIAGYQALPTGALRYGASLINGLHKRLGEIRHLASMQAEKEEATPRKEFFLREQSSRSDFSGDRAPDFDQDIRFVQVGGSFVKWNTDEMGSTLRLGGALSYGSSNLGAKSSSTKVDLKGLTLALMSTYQGARGQYIDLVAQGTQYRADVRTSERGNIGNPKGWGLGLSVEGGYPVEIGEKLILEPQAQLAYQRVRFDRFTDVDNIAVDLESGASLRGRAGLRIQKTYETQGQQWSPFAEINLLHEFLKGNTIKASGVGFRSDLSGTSLQFGTGLNAQIRRDAALFLTLGYEKGISKGSANTLSGTAGVRMSF